MAERKKTAIERDVERLVELALRNLDHGFTYIDVEREIGWQRPYFFKIARQFRLTYGSADMNLVCERPGGRADRPHVYRLTGDVVQIQAYGASRIPDLVARVDTLQQVAASAVNATDGRSREGRIARRVARHMTRLQEDLVDLSA